jgi:hypothetical protein
MEQIAKNQDYYSIPFLIRSGYKPRMHFLFLSLIAMFLSFSIFVEDELPGRVIVFSLVVLLLYCWIYVGVLRKSFVEVTGEGILLKTIFVNKSVKWPDIAAVETFSMQRNTYIGIKAYQKLHARKENFITSLSEAYGGGYSLTIPLGIFPYADTQKLYATIFNIAQEKAKYHDRIDDIGRTLIKEVKREDVKAGNPIKSLIYALIVSVVIGIIYGFSIYQFHINLLLIPLLGIMGIVYVFNKNYRNHDRNIAVRLAMGVMCAMQFYMAALVLLFVINLKYAVMNGFLRTIADCSIYIFQHPGEFLNYYLYAAIFFIFGALQGYSSKTTRRIRKAFMGKRNGFTIKKEKRYTSVFLVDYEEYLENEDKRIVSIPPNTCLIERSKNEILAFYIPEELIRDLNIWPNKLERTSVNGDVHYKLNLGSSAEKQSYGYSCNLIINKNKQVELIQLESD